MILENDPFLKGKIVTDEFASCGMVRGSLPWNQREGKRRWEDVDYAGYYRYMETFYGITGKEKLDNGLLIVSSQNKVNEVKEYLTSLKWDGVKRVDTLLSDYLGADDNLYTRAVIRKSLCAAVARGILGGVKYDYMPIFAGPVSYTHLPLPNTRRLLPISDPLPKGDAAIPISLLYVLLHPPARTFCSPWNPLKTRCRCLYRRIRTVLGIYSLYVHKPPYRYHASCSETV